jgi:hypothetical protein
MQQTIIISIPSKDKNVYGTPVSAQLFESPRDSWESAKLFNTHPNTNTRKTSMSMYSCTSCCSGNLFGGSSSSWKSGHLYISSPHNNSSIISPISIEDEFVLDIIK